MKSSHTEGGLKSATYGKRSGMQSASDAPGHHGKLDQAATLRRQRFYKAKKMQGITRVISFTSGKGGVGKTHTVLNTGIALAREGKGVLILDADLGLANINVLLGLEPRWTLHDVFEGRKSLSDIIITGPEGVSIIPAASGVEHICTLDPERKLMLMEQIEEVAHQFDYLLIDTRAGISPDVMYFNSASSEIVCVITNEPTSLTDAYAVIKVLSQSYGERSFSVVSNNVANQQEGQLAFQRLARSVARFLHVDLKYLGFIPTDILVREAIQNQRSILETYPSSKAALALHSLARKIDEEFLDLRVKGGMQFFFRQLLEANVSGI